jgi:hypothetical protein
MRLNFKNLTAHLKPNWIDIQPNAYSALILDITHQHRLSQPSSGSSDQ